jgi:P-type Cu+ transporter
VKDFRSVTAGGVVGTVAGRAVMVGKPDFLRNEKITGLEPLEASAVKLQEDGKTAMFVAIDGKPAGILAVADPIKATTAEAIKELHALGLKLVMLTGDNRRTAAAVAKQLGLDAVEAEIEPAGKVAHVKKLRAEGKHVAMAGDGINDAPALSEAEVGIAMGTGTDVAMQSAGITLVKGDLRGIAKAIRLSRATMRNIRQNLVFAFSTTRWAFRWRRACSTRSSAAAQPDHRRRRDEPEFRLGHQQRLAPCDAFCNRWIAIRFWD